MHSAGRYIDSVREVQHLAVGGAALVLMLVPAVLVPLALRIRGRAPFAVAALVSGWGSIVLVFEVLSLFDGLTTGGILLGQAVAAAAAAGGWRAAGAPRPSFPALPRSAELLVHARAHPAVAALGLLAACSLLLQFVLGVAVLPNTWDSMSYHLSRGAYWLQQDSMGWIEGGHVRQVANPPAGEALQTWTLVDDRTATGSRSSVQWAGAGRADGRGLQRRAAASATRSLASLFAACAVHADAAAAAAVARPPRTT